jgi:uncharacterized protein
VGADFAPWAGAAQAASFDCSKAVSRTDHMICDDVSLNMLDGQLKAAYAGALDRSNDPERVTAKQKAWLKERDSCPDQQCMIAAYQRQIGRLSKISDEPVTCAGATTTEVDACTKAYADRADKELERYVAAARKRIVDETAQGGSAGQPATLADFDASQAAWVSYRKTECKAVFDWWSDGTIRGAMWAGCWESVTKARTTAIWDNWLTFMDSTPALMPKPSEAR